MRARPPVRPHVHRDLPQGTRRRPERACERRSRSLPCRIGRSRSGGERGRSPPATRSRKTEPARPLSPTHLLESAPPLAGPRRGSRGAALGGGRAGAEPPGNPWCGCSALSYVGSSSSIRTEPDEQQSALLDLRCAHHSKPRSRGSGASSAVATSAAGARSGKLIWSSSRRRWGCHMTVPTEVEGPHDGGRVRDRPAGGSELPATNYRGSAPKSPAGAAPRTRDVHGGPQRCVRGVVHDVLAGGRSSPRPASCRSEHPTTNYRGSAGG